jgi:hypothetical protein
MDENKANWQTRLTIAPERTILAAHDDRFIRKYSGARSSRHEMQPAFSVSLRCCILRAFSLLVRLYSAHAGAGG